MSGSEPTMLAVCGGLGALRENTMIVVSLFGGAVLELLFFPTLQNSCSLGETPRFGSTRSSNDVVSTSLSLWRCCLGDLVSSQNTLVLLAACSISITPWVMRVLGRRCGVLC